MLAKSPSAGSIPGGGGSTAGASKDGLADANRPTAQPNATLPLATLRLASKGS